ncbi:Lrp/AsnC family transcriptional regulator [Geodermatophilus sp. DSM 44513]|uniref:Lrp/AsnC family transcriptional regulator n=1 Tax=Geodermatophilus sp. DSM 44513 TaxID=1528104 RepID=UPI0012869BBA|nr:Lrp/AsnC family transcriptional regulator [Geodermatophilus sp. DSM 44513]WNV76315.1 Lrp/AsnC family transcriptional regulator [Geodermatophilus sp. DSM 44513]
MDELDWAIVQRLVRDARTTYGRIGSEVALSAPAVKRRVDRLVRSGAIRGFTAVLDPAVLAWDVEAYVWVYCEGAPDPEEVRRQFEEVPEVVQATTISGTADAVVRLQARDTAELERAVRRLRALPTVSRTESAVVLSRLIDRSRL